MSKLVKYVEHRDGVQYIHYGHPSAHKDRISKENSPISNSSKPRSRRRISSRGIGIFAIVFIIILASAIFSKMQGGEIVTFQSFLNYLTTVPNINMDWAVIPTITADWGIFDWALDTINLISNLLNFAGFIAKAGINALLFVVWGLRFILF